jgi:hypothetical protein
MESWRPSFHRPALDPVGLDVAGHLAAGDCTQSVPGAQNVAPRPQAGRLIEDPVALHDLSAPLLMVEATSADGQDRRTACGDSVQIGGRL